MGLFSNFPYSDFENINLDWISNNVREYIDKFGVLSLNFNELKEYVTNYFINLDVQEEINNKLQEMYDSGELSDIIQEYLQVSSLLTFDTKTDLKEATNLTNGVDVLTLGTSTYLDGNTHLYKVRTLTSSDIIDDINIIALYNYPTLIAELIPSNVQTLINNSLDVAYNSHVRTDDHLFYFHINGDTGDDSNDGLTSDTPFKTITKAFEYISKSKDGKNDLRINLDVNGVYEIPYQNISSIVLHIKGTGANSILNFTTAYDATIYNSHVNMQNVTIRTSSTQYGLKVDGGTCSFNSVVFENLLRVHANDGVFTSCNFKKNLQALFSNLYFNGCTNSNTDPSLTAFSFTDCVVGFQGTNTNAQLSADGTENAIIYARSSVLLGVFTAFNTATGRYYYGLQALNSTILMPKVYIDAFRTRSVSQIDYSINNGGNLIIETQGSTPIRLGTNTVRYNPSTNKLQYYDTTTNSWTDITL